MRWTALALVFASSPALSQGTTDSESIRGNVLVWHDATLYTDASDTAPAIHVATLAKRELGRVVPLRVVSTKGAFVEVELAASATGDCVGATLSTSDDIAKLHLFVKRADLAPVLAKPFTKTFADGTKVTLKAGLPVQPGDTSVAFDIAGSTLSADIPAANIAHSYTLERERTVLNMGAQDFQLAANTTVTLGDHNATLGATHVSAIQKKGATTLVTLEARCATVQVAAPAHAVKDVEESSLDGVEAHSSATSVLGLRNEEYLPINTPLSVDNRAIALVAKPIYLPAAPMGKQACIDRKVILEDANATAADDNKLRLCAPASKISRDRSRSVGRR